MSSDKAQTDVQASAQIRAQHQMKGGTYLIVADGSDEFQVALNYAGRMSVANGCHVGVLYVIEQNEFQHWGNVEARMRAEQREAAEATLLKACFDLAEAGCAMPSLYIEEGGRMEVLFRVIENDQNISMLILAADTHGSGPGPLVSHLTGKGLSRLRVPVMVVPDHFGKDLDFQV